MSRARPRLVIVDDHRLVVQGLKQMLGRRYDVVGVAYAGDELLALLRDTPADVVLLDLSLPGRGGLELLPEILAAQPQLRVLVVTMHVDRILADAAFAAGATGFVPKDAGVEELERALRSVLAGKRYRSDLVPKTSHRLGPDAAHPSLARLTPRQQSILRLIGKGKTSAEIAGKLGLTESTITFHRQRIRRLLGLASEWELVRHAILVEVASQERKSR